VKGAKAAAGIPDIVEVRLPDAEAVFAARAERFRELAQGSALGEYLRACAALAEAQGEALAAGAEAGWRPALETILRAMGTVPLPAEAREAIGRLGGFSREELEAAAERLLAGNYAGADLPHAPFIGAALQAVWTARAGAAGVPEGKGARDCCPVCASAPVAGVVAGDIGVRHLVCSLCATEWYLPRLCCSACGSTEEMTYLALEGSSTGVKAECCDRCRTYLKLFYRESAPGAEPFADDAATVALDIRTAGEGYARAGANIYLLPGP
jgi:FdhE protein